MKVYQEISLSEFEFWAGGKDTVEELTDSELEQIEQILEEIYPNKPEMIDLPFKEGKHD